MIGLTDLVALADRILDLEPSQASLSETKLDVIGPDEALDSHSAKDYGVMRRFVISDNYQASPR